MKPGLHLDVPADTYHADPCEAPSLSSSIAELLVNDCPARAYHHHPRLGGYRKKSSEGMDRGSIVHNMILGVGKEFKELPFPDFRTKAAQLARDACEARGVVPILEHKKRELDYAVLGITARLEDLGISFQGGHKEAVLHWIEFADDGTPVPCRAMLDHVLLTYRTYGEEKCEGVLITDLKTCESAHPKACGKSAANYGYDIQWATYTSAARKLWPDAAGREHMRFISCETEAPYLVTPWSPDGVTREVGERKWRRAVNLWAECTRTGEWPMYVRRGEEARVSMPVWATTEEE